MKDPQPFDNEYVLRIPLGQKRHDLILDPRDIDGARDLAQELQWLSVNVRDDDECDRIMRLTVMLHSQTERPMNECLRQAVIWERG